MSGITIVPASAADRNPNTRVTLKSPCSHYSQEYYIDPMDVKYVKDAYAIAKKRHHRWESASYWEDTKAIASLFENSAYTGLATAYQRAFGAYIELKRQDAYHD